MKRYSLFTLLVILASLPGAFLLQAQERLRIDLSDSSWNITLDKKAEWKTDKLYLPPVDIKQLPVHIPTGWWELLNTPDKENVTLPATVEEYLWGRRGDTFGVNENYTGVSWFTTNCIYPAGVGREEHASQSGAVRFRAEIFVNRQLAGYDLVNSTPFDVDVSAYLMAGAENEIAFRITDPNGNFNWKDSQVYTWGSYYTDPTHGFGGITGKVSLVATEKLYVSDIFIKNQPKPDEVEVGLTISNLTGAKDAKKLTLEVFKYRNGNRVYAKEIHTMECPVEESTQSYRISVPKARLWSVDEPNLYNLTVTLGEDKETRRFGFRWFEVRDVNGKIVVTSGDDTLFAVKLNTSGIPRTGSVADTTGILQSFIRTAGFEPDNYIVSGERWRHTAQWSGYNLPEHLRLGICFLMRIMPREMNKSI